MVAAAAAAQTTMALDLFLSRAIAACALCTELATGAAGKHDSSGGDVSVFRDGISLLSGFLFCRTLEVASNWGSHRFWSCGACLVLRGAALETELGLFVRLHFSVDRGQCLWQSAATHPFRTIACWRCCNRAYIFASEIVGLSKGCPALSSLYACLYSRPANTGDEARRGLTRCAQFRSAGLDILRRTGQG